MWRRCPTIRFGLYNIDRYCFSSQNIRYLAEIVLNDTLLYWVYCFTIAFLHYYNMGGYEKKKRKKNNQLVCNFIRRLYIYTVSQYDIDNALYNIIIIDHSVFIYRTNVIIIHTFHVLVCFRSRIALEKKHEILLYQYCSTLWYTCTTPLRWRAQIFKKNDNNIYFGSYILLVSLSRDTLVLILYAGIKV